MLGYDFNHKLHRCERGVVMVFFAILLPLLFGFMGLSLDAGLAYVEKGKAQDIADAAALAGAAHLSDEDRDTTVKDAVKAYVEANGIKLGANDLVNRVDGSAWDAKDTLAKGQDALVSYSIVSVTKDGETRDRVRVRITKRAPLFFFNVLGDFSDGLVVAAKAAAEGGSEVKVIDNGIPVSIGVRFNQYYSYASNLVLSNSNSFPVYAYRNPVDPHLLPGTGRLYSSNLANTSWTYDYELKDLVFTPPLPEGREVTSSNPNWSYYNISGNETAKLQDAAQKALSQEMLDKVNDYFKRMEEKVNAIRGEVDSYKTGHLTEGSIKRYIGPDSKGKIINTIKDTDTEIDLYMVGTCIDHWSKSQRSILVPGQLKNVKKVNTLIFGKEGYIETENISFGNIYNISDGRLFIAGKENTISGTIYSNCNTYLGGYDNHIILKAGEPSIYVGSSNIQGRDGNIDLNVGQWADVKETQVYKKVQDPVTGQWEYAWVTTLTDTTDTLLDAKNNADWKLYFDYVSEGSGSSSGTGSEGSATTTKLRLVE